MVLISPEQHPQSLSMHLGEKSALQGMDGQWRLLGRVKREDWGLLLAHLPAFSLEKWRAFLKGEAFQGEGIYARSSFNAWGDIESPLARENTMPGFYDSSFQVSYDPRLLEEDFARRLKDYARKAKKKGALVYWSFCPVNRLALSQEAYAPDDFYNFLEEKLSFPLLGDPGNAVLEEEWFFDTNFHLNQSGRVLYTVQLIRDLKAAWGIREATDIPLLTPPALPLPSGSVLLASRWRGNGKVEEITLPEDTVQIEDYSFEGCTGLQKIHLLSREPSRILIGDHLLDGCPACLVVPQGSLSAFRTDYRYSRYASRIREES